MDTGEGLTERESYLTVGSTAKIISKLRGCEPAHFYRLFDGFRKCLDNCISVTRTFIFQATLPDGQNLPPGIKQCFSMLLITHYIPRDFLIPKFTSCLW